VIRKTPQGAIRRALLAGKRRPRISGGSPTSRRGDGYEFVELREYVAGDDVRRIDWAASARSGELQTRVILEDIALVLAAIVDDSPSMSVGRDRALTGAAFEAVREWYGVAQSEDRCLRVGASQLQPRGSLRGAASAHAALHAEDSFELGRSLENARTALRAGAALLVVSDFFDLEREHEPVLHALGRRFDCTALIARDPWYEGLALRGIVRLHGAEGGTVRGFVGARERAEYARAVRSREAELRVRLQTAGWRVGLLHERDGAGSLAAAFGLRHDLAS
jgi:uncharacterized protein (DUF58 family)